MKLSNQPIVFIGLIGLSFFFAACQNPKPDVNKEFSDAKTTMETEFTEQMSQKGNSEISIDDIQKDLNKKDAELENLMQEMEDEMDADTSFVENNN